LGATVFFDLSATRSCPYCGKKIKHEAIKCRFCGEFSQKNTEQNDVCVACQVMMVVCIFILLIGIAVFIWQSSGW